MTKPMQDWIGRSETARDVVTPALLERHAATIGGDAAQVSLGIHWCLCAPATKTAELGIDGHPPKGAFLPPVPLPRRMWAGSEVEFLAPLTAGDDVTRRSTINSAKSKTGSTGPLVFIKVEHVIMAGGRECVKDLQTIVYRDAPAGPMAMPAHEGFEPPAGQRTKTVRPKEALLFRYSAITFNTHRIHYDAQYAMAEEGYPALVVHGPLMASLMLDFASEQFGADQIASFKFQAVSPAFVGQDLHLAIQEPALADGHKQCGWTVFGADGRNVMAGTLDLR